MARAQRKNNYEIITSYVDSLPDNGNAKSFKSFIKEEESNELIYELQNSPKVLNIFSNLNHNILNFNYDEYHLYFRIIENMMKNNHSAFRKHMEWMGNNLNYSQLFEIQYTYPLIKVDLMFIIFTNEDNEEMVFNFFEK